MLASDIMKKPAVIAANARVSDALGKLIATGHRMLPAVDEANHAVGLFSAFAMIGHLVPDYIVSGDLEDVSYAPDFGLLRRRYDESEDRLVSELMGDKPFVIKPEESALSAAAALLTHAGHDCVLVEDSTGALVGIITPADVLNSMRIGEKPIA